MTSSTAKRKPTPCLKALVLALACAGAAPAQADFAAEAAKLRSAPAKDATLHKLQAGVAALAENRQAESSELFDGALDSIEGLYANTENAAKARSLWYEEGAKDYKGEPYERAMAFWYRGLLYLAGGDYENARASFRGGVLQDAFVEEDQHRSDFASLMMLDGWASQLNGDKGLAEDAYKDVARLRPNWKAPQKDANLLVIAELGGSPRKVGDGIGNHEIVYRKAKRMPERSIRIELDGKPVAPVLAEDLFYQAATRGGRPVDRLIAGKVQFQNVTGGIADVAGTLASDLSVWNAAAGGGSGNALGAVAAVGAIAGIFSANVKPRADVRYWNNLPETMHMATLRHNGLPQQVKVALFDEAGQPVESGAVQVHKRIDKRGNVLVWIKTRN